MLKQYKNQQGKDRSFPILGNKYNFKMIKKLNLCKF